MAEAVPAWSTRNVDEWQLISQRSFWTSWRFSALKVADQIATSLSVVLSRREVIRNSIIGARAIAILPRRAIKRTSILPIIIPRRASIAMWRATRVASRIRWRIARPRRTVRVHVCQNVRQCRNRIHSYLWATAQSYSYEAANANELDGHRGSYAVCCLAESIAVRAELAAGNPYRGA